MSIFDNSYKRKRVNKIDIRGTCPRYACVRYLSELLSLLVFINGGYLAVSL